MNTIAMIKFCSCPDTNKSGIAPKIPTIPNSATILHLMIIAVTMVSIPIKEETMANRGNMQ